ncbi:MAG TPA: ribosome-binding factor A [Gemmataceae bacterium]|nr:ribosome-binding factor A [Gemmataceae bacterium]
MKRKKISRRAIRSCADDIGPEDGLDPRLFFRKRSEKKIDRKVLQLCGEVSRTLSQVLAWELGDNVLSQVRIESVVPAPDSSRLLVAVSLPAAGTSNPERVLQRLHQLTGRLRSEIAAAVARRRVPELAFQVTLRAEEGP